MSILHYTGEGKVKLSQCSGQKTDPLLLLPRASVYLINVIYIFQGC